MAKEAKASLFDRFLLNSLCVKPLKPYHLIVDLCFCRLNESLKVLELELQVTEQGTQAAAVEKLLGDKEVPLEYVLLGTAGRGEPSSYASELSKLQIWVDSSLDTYRVRTVVYFLTAPLFFYIFLIIVNPRLPPSMLILFYNSKILSLLQPELLHMFYPIFVHTYLQLVNLGAASVAHALLAESKSSILTSSISPRQRKSRGSELHDLLSISTPEQLETNNLAKALRAQRTPIRLSKYGYDLVLQYLRQSDMLLMLGVINQWLAVEIVAEAVAPAALDDGGLLAGVGGDGVDAGTINQIELDLRLLNTSAEHVYEAEIMKVASDEATKLAEDENATKKEKQARQKAATEAKEKVEKVGEKFMEATIPLPSIDKQVQQALLKHLKASESAGAGGKPVSGDVLPSAAFLTFINAQQTLNSISMSSAGNSAVAGFADSSVRIYNLDNKGDNNGNVSASSTAPIILRGHSGPVYATDFSPDDQLLLSSSADGTARLWSSKLSVGLVVYQGHMLPVWDVAFAPDYGYYFATSSADRTARIWATERTQPLRIFTGHQSDVDVIKWHPNCHYVVTGSSDRSVRVWDLRSGGCVRTLLGHNAPITALAVSHDGATVASADASGALSTWDLGAARRVGGSTTAHNGPVWSLDYSYGEGKVLASGGSDCRVKLWSSSSSAEGGAGTGLSCVAMWSTKATPVIATSFTKRNLLLAAGPLSLC